MRFVSLLRRLLPRGTPAPTEGPAVAPDHGAAEAPLAFQDLYRQLDSPDAQSRYEAAMLVGALSPSTAVMPLTRAYVHHGDRFLLDALRVYGSKLTLAVGRETIRSTRGPTERGRLIQILGASKDPDAVPIVRRAVGDLEPFVHVAACASLVELGVPEAAAWLEEELLGIDPERRLTALRAAAELAHPAAVPVLEDHLRRYLAAGGAVPREVTVSMPFLLDPPSDLPALIARRIRRSPRSLAIVIGPQADALAESRRQALAAELPGFRLRFTTTRHSPPEQLEVLLRARDEAAAAPDSPVVLVGPLPSPGGPHPPPHFLARTAGAGITARIVFVGQQEFAVVMEWWRYVADRSEVPTDFDVLMTALTFGAEEMTDEELVLCRMAGDERREAFARALLVHRTSV